MVKPAVMIAGMCLLSASVASATTILDTNFDSADGTYTNGSVINASGAATEQMSVKLANSSSALNVVGGKLEFTDNSTASSSVAGGPAIEKSFSGVGNGVGQDSLMTIQFNLTYLIPTTTASKPTIQFLLNSNSESVSNTSTAINMMINTGACVYYQDGQSGSFTSGALTQGTDYHFKIDINFATGKWSLLVTDGGPTPFIDKTGIATRASMTGFAPALFIANGGNNQNNVNASPFVQLDNLNIVSNSAAVPEPAAFSLLAIGAAGLLLGRRSR